MIPRYAWGAAGALVLLSPVLAFPEARGPEHGWASAAVAIVALALATGLVRDFGRLSWAVGLFGLAAVIGWSRSADQMSTLNHFCGVALGLLAMATVAYTCRTRQMLALASCVVLLMGTATLSVGVRSITPIHGTKALRTNPLTTPGQPVPLPLADLHSRRTVNPNALGATAMMILPVAVAVAAAPARWFRLGLALRLSGVLTAGWAAVMVVLMQSRSVWISAGFVLLLLARRWIGPRLWWLGAVALCLVLPAALFLLAADHPRVMEATALVGARSKIWGEAFEALRFSPWVGIGFDYFRHSGFSLVQIAPDRVIGAPHAHNIFIQTALDTGLFGLACYLAIIGLVLTRAIALVRSSSGDVWARYVGAGAALSVVSVHIFGLLDAIPLGAKVGIFQWLSCGLILAAWRMRTQSEGT